MKKKNIGYFIIFAILTVASVFFIGKFSGCSLKELYWQITEVNKGWTICALLLVPGYIVFEGMSFVSLIKGLSPIKRTHGNLFAAADIYFSAITPSATGGQPASAFFMVKYGVPGAVTTVVLLVNLFMFFAALFICGVVSIIVEPGLFFGYEILAQTLIIIGIVVLIICMVFFVMVLKHEAMVDKFFRFLIKLGAKMRLVRHPERRHAKLDNMIEQYETCSSSIIGKRRMLVKAFGYNMLQRLSRGGVFICSYMALGGNFRNVLKVWVVQTYASLGANLLPIPGGIGTTDYLLLDGFRNVEDISNVANMTLLSRGISFYGCIVLSVIIIGVEYFRRGKKKGVED